MIFLIITQDFCRFRNFVDFELFIRFLIRNNFSEQKQKHFFFIILKQLLIFQLPYYYLICFIYYVFRIIYYVFYCIN